MLSDLLMGFYSCFHPGNFLALVGGTVAGIIAGAIPGLDCSVATALLLPLTYKMTPSQAFVFLAGIYCGGVYGGQIPAILFRVPGASEAVMTTLDGYPMAQKGEAGKALGVGLLCSLLGGLFSCVILILLAPPLANFALEFGPAEYFALSVLGLSCISSLGAKSQTKAIISALLGLLFATVGIDQITGMQRFTFGTGMLQGGINFIPAVIGLFAAAEVYNQISQKRYEIGIVTDKEKTKKVKVKLPSISELWPIKWSMLRSAIVGTWIGILPGVGATTAAIVGYATAVRFSKHPEKFGTGIIEGVAAPETANNAATGGAMVPLLALGIPGSATTAIMIGAFYLHGLQIGPMFLQQHKPLAYTIFAGMTLANVIFFILGFFAIKAFAKVLELKYPYLAANILAFCGVGAVAMGDIYGMKMMFIFAILGFFMEKYGYPVAPIVLGLVLGPIAEPGLRRALLIADYDVWLVLTRPITAFLLILSIFSLLTPLLRNLFSRRKGHEMMDIKSQD
jgi:putative tricarboxylic transport membrane protein